MLKIRIAVAMGSIAILLLAGCGGSKPAAKGPAGSADDAIQAPVFPEGSSLERIQQSGKLRVGVAFNQPGFGVKLSADIEPEGFDIEIAKLIAQGVFGGIANDASQHIEYVETVSTNRETFLQNDKADIVIASYPITDARRKLVDFAGPYYLSHGDVMVQVSDRGLQQISDLNGQSVCTKAGSLLVPALQSKAPQVNVNTADTYAQCVQRLHDGVVNGVVSDEVLLAGLVQSSNGTTRLLGSSFSNDPYGIGVRKDDDALRAFLNDRLEVIESDGDWQKAYGKTIGQLGLDVPQPPSVDRYIATTRSDFLS